MTTSKMQLENIERAKSESFLDPDHPIGIPKVGYPVSGPSIPQYYRTRSAFPWFESYQAASASL